MKGCNEMSKTEISSIVTATVAVAKLFGVEIPNEVFIGLGSLIAVFMRMAIRKTNPF